ncbi:MAG: glutathione S-transferase family protein [Pseudomonadota bacterium]
MKLYTAPLAPNPTRVMLYLAEREVLGASFDIEPVIVSPLEGEQRAPEHLARNPFGTLPVLEMADGQYLIESRVIIDYLEELEPTAPLLPADLAARALVRDLERSLELRIALPIMRLVHAEQSPLGFPPNPELAAQLREGLNKPLDVLENTLDDGRALLAGAAVSIADCLLAAVLQFARFAKMDVLGERPRLNAWDERYRARPAAQQVLQW